MIIVRCCELSWESALRQKCIWVGRTQIRLLIDVANKALTLRFRFLSIRFTLILGGGAAFPKTPWACPRLPHGLRCGLFGGRSCGRASLATLDFFHASSSFANSSGVGTCPAILNQHILAARVGESRADGGPLPQFLSSKMILILSMAGSTRNFSRVPSVEPSSTTMISFLTGEARTALSSSSRCTTSLCTGTITDTHPAQRSCAASSLTYWRAEPNARELLITGYPRLAL